MNRRRVRFTATARDQVRLLKDWWLANSPRPEMLDQDLTEAVRTLAILPGIGSAYSSGPVTGLRRLYLDRLTSHLYYTYDRSQVVVRCLWHARRGSGPEFGSKSRSRSAAKPTPPRGAR